MPRLVDEVWGDDPPVTAGNVLQTYVSQLRKSLGRDAIGTRGRGYVVAVRRDPRPAPLERHASAARRREPTALGDAAVESAPPWPCGAAPRCPTSPTSHARGRLRRVWTGCDRWLWSARSRRTSPAAATPSLLRSSTGWRPRTPCTSASGRCRCWPSTAPAARPMRSMPSAAPVRSWSSSSASSPGPPCGSAASDPRSGSVAGRAARGRAVAAGAPIATDPRRIMAAAFARRPALPRRAGRVAGWPFAARAGHRHLGRQRGGAERRRRAADRPVRQLRGQGVTARTQRSRRSRPGRPHAPGGRAGRRAARRRRSRRPARGARLLALLDEAPCDVAISSAPGRRRPARYSCPSRARATTGPR